MIQCQFLQDLILIPFTIQCYSHYDLIDNIYQNRFLILMHHQMIIKEPITRTSLSLYILIILLLFFNVKSASVQDITLELNKSVLIQQDPSIQAKNQISDQSQNQTKQEQLNNMFDKLNFLITTYFDNCLIDKESKLMEKCSIQKNKFSQFLYGIFHKQILRGYLIYQQRKNPQNFQMQDFQAKGQQIRKLAIEAYNQWIQIYFPNKRIEVEEFYYIFNSIQESILEIIQHSQKFNALTQIMKEIMNVTLTPKQHLNQGNKSNDQIQTDIAMLYAQNFDNQCQFPKNCYMPLKRFTHFVKQMAYYMIPVKQEWKRQNGKVLISPDLDFQVSNFLIKQVQTYSEILGENVDYEQIKVYTFLLTQNLFQHLISQHQKLKQTNYGVSQSNFNGKETQDQNQNKQQIAKDGTKQETYQVQPKIDADVQL